MFIKTSSQIILEAESGEVYKITPLNGSVLIESQPNIEPNVDFTIDDELAKDVLVKLEKHWHEEDGFAKPEFQRNRDGVPENDIISS